MAEILDQQNTSGALGVGFGDTGSGRDYMCQGFIPTLDNVTAVSFWISSKSGSADVGYAVWIDAADANFYPTGTVFVGVGGFTEITNASLTTGSLVKYTLSTPATGLTPGNRYVICFAPYNTTTNAWASAYIDWRTSVSNPYANGRRVHGDSAFTSWSAPDSGNADIQFETYGDDASTTTSSSSSSSSTSSTSSSSTSTTTTLAPGCYLLQEIGDNLLQETGDNIVLENCSDPTTTSTSSTSSSSSSSSTSSSSTSSTSSSSSTSSTSSSSSTSSTSSSSSTSSTSSSSTSSTSSSSSTSSTSSSSSTSSTSTSSTSTSTTTHPYRKPHIEVVLDDIQIDSGK